MNIRLATAIDLKAIEALRQADSDCVGFVPLQRYEHIVCGTLDGGRDRSAYERIYVVEDSCEITGFAYGGLHRTGLKIEQICVRRDARMFNRARGLVLQLEQDAWALPRGICRVAEDIEAVAFWSAIGWTPIGRTTSTWLNRRASKSQRPLIIFEHRLAQPLLLESHYELA